MNALSLTKELIKIRRTDKLNQLKHKSYRDIAFEYINENAETIQENIPSILKNIHWFKKLLKLNNIDKIEFLAWLELIKNQRYQKINALVLYGITNAGKSMAMRAATAILHPTEISRERDNNSFHLDQLPYAVAALFEEPIITPINVATWKLILEGADVTTDIKNSDKETIPR